MDEPHVDPPDVNRRRAVLTAPLTIPLPAQPEGVPWPTEAWPRGEVPAGVGLDAHLDALFGDRERYGETYAVVVVHRGRLVAERYGGELVHFDRDAEPVVATTRLLSWSMAKSIVHAAVGIVVRDGRLDLEAPAPVPAWHHDPDDPRAAITLQHLLEMRDGLDFNEAYTLDAPSDVVEMLFGAGKDDVAAYAAARPLAHEPGSTFNYASGSTNLVARVLGDLVGGGADGMRAFLERELFRPIGMASAEPRFDAAGTFVGSSYVYATAQDFARFGLLYLRGGVWDGRQLLPVGWVDHGRRARSYDAGEDRFYGAHWWSPGDDLETFNASGYEGQGIFCVPALDLVVVRLGKTPDANSALVREWHREVREAFRAAMAS